jgi:hypothetical protein
VVSQLKVNEIIKQSGSSITIGEAGDTALGVFTSTPYFRAFLNANQSIADGTRTLVLFNEESFDASSAYDTSTGRFTPQTSGYYYISAALKSDTGTNFTNLTVYLRKNGTEMLEVSAFNDAYNSTFGATIIQLNGSTDYVDVAANQNSGGAINLDGNSAGKKNFFTAFKLVG